jgi:pyrroline-5-carboxylate reductase
VKDSILIVGAGNMGMALARGIIKSQFSSGCSVRVFDVKAEKLAGENDARGISFVSTLTEPMLADAAIVLCVKPQDLESVAGMLATKIPKKSMIISILAGITIKDVETAFSFHGAVVRAMPNIAATVGAAATAMCANAHLSQAQRDIAYGIFNAIGEADWTKESLLDAVTGLSGSGPAYLYMVIEALTDGGVKMGLPRNLAGRLAAQTVLGSAMLVKETGLHPAILREQVTTPGGTTIAAIHELEERGLRAMLISAVETATKRAADLRKKV